MSSPRFASFLVIDRRRGNEGVRSRRCVSFPTTNDRQLFPLASVSDEPRPSRHLPTTFPINPWRTCFQRDSTPRFVYEERGEEGTSTFHLVTRFAYRITMIIACEISARDSVETSCLRTENVHRVVDQRKDKINWYFTDRYFSRCPSMERTPFCEQYASSDRWICRTLLILSINFPCPFLYLLFVQ